MSEKLHPIQLKEILVKNLSMELIDPTITQKNHIQIEFGMHVGYSDFDEQDSIIMIGVKGSVKDADTQKNAFNIEVEIQGFFEVDTKLFPIDKLSDWASKNAPLILLPYLRENIYTLSTRAKLNIILPLYILPTIRL